MVGRAHEDDVRGQAVDLEEQCGDDALDLPRLVLVRPLLRNCVELVEEEHAAAGPYELESAVQTGRGLAEETGDHALVADDVERQHELSGDGLGHARLAVAGRARQQEAMPGFDAVTAQQVRPLLLLDELGDDTARHGCQLQVLQTPSRHHLVNEIAR